MYQSLQNAVSEMPVGLARSILIGIESQPVVVGAYVHDGGACPVLIGQRHGSRNTSCLELVYAWDAYCRARKPRLATDRETTVLKSLLQARVFGAERNSYREACADCSRPLHVDYHGACAQCGSPAQEASQHFSAADDTMDIEPSYAA